MPYYLEKSWERSHKHFPEGMNLQMINDPMRLTYYHDYFKTYAEDKIILDVGAGLGLIGLKALEFGAKHVYLVEQHPHTAKSLRKILSQHPKANQVTLIEGDFHYLTKEHFNQNADILVCELWGPHLWNEGLYPTHAKAKELFPEIETYPNTYKSHLNIVKVPWEETALWPREQLKDVKLIDLYKQEYLGYLLDRHDVNHIDLTKPEECFSLIGDQFISRFTTQANENYKDVFFHLSHSMKWNEKTTYYRSTYFYMPEIRFGQKFSIELDETYLPLFEEI